jgi:hypothetical protein
MRTLFIALLFCLSLALQGQFTEPKFGKVEMSDLSMQKYEKDTTAGALVLFDCGSGSIILNLDEKFQCQFERHCQIKIFKNSSFDLADRKIRLYQTENGKEKLQVLNAVTYNLVDGKIVKSKLDNKKIYKTEEDNYQIVSFAMPDVREGSVIELSYTIVSDFLYNFNGWNFQCHYPQRWNQYVYEIPVYFDYRVSTKGYLAFDKNEKKDGNTSFAIESETADGSSRFRDGHSASTTDFIKVDTKKTILAMKDVPAFIDEPNIDCDNNYIQSIEFELGSIKMPGGLLKNYTDTWESVNKRMVEASGFGALLDNSRFLSDSVEAICAGKATEAEKASAIYEYVQNRIKWNGKYRIFAADGLKKPFSERVASSSEINLLLTLMFRAAKLKSNPVLISTRDNGVAVSYYPTITKYNSVLSSVDIDGILYLADATDKFCPFGVLPANDLNGQGRIVNSYSGDWVDLVSKVLYSVNRMYKLDLSADGKFSGSVDESYGGYAGIEFRNNLVSLKDEGEYVRLLQENNKGLTISKHTLGSRENNSAPVTNNLEVEISDNTEEVGDKILFNPLLFERIEKNRYTLEDRKYPVNYNYPITERFFFTYTIPDGFSVESLPNSSAISMPDNSISITYNVQASGNKIEVRYIRKINKVLFITEEYQKLKNLYDQLVKMHSESVILKRNT